MTGAERMTDEELAALVKTAAAGDKEAVERLMLALKPLVSSIARRYFLTDGDENDVMQEGMIGLFGAISSYDPSRNESFAAFAALCIHRRIRSAIRVANSRRNRALTDGISLDEAAEPTDGMSAEDAFFREESAKALAAARAKLSRDDDALLELYLEGESYAGIARRLGLTTKKVDNTLQRIKRTLRSEIV